MISALNNWDLINQSKEIYFGQVVSISDPLKTGKIRVRVIGVYDNIPEEHLPWALPEDYSDDTHSLPPIGSTVFIKFINNDIYYPVWYQIRGKEVNLDDDDYQSGEILVQKDLSKYQDSGKLIIRYLKSSGLELVLGDNDDSTIIIRKDNTVYLQNGKTGDVIHISDKGISLGSQDESQQSGVLGENNQDSLNDLNDFINAIANTLSTGLTGISTVAASNPYTAPLAAPLNQLKAQVETIKAQYYQPNKSGFAKTLSKKITLD